MSVCVFCVCGRKGNSRSCDGLCLCVFVCVCVSVFVCRCLFVGVCMSLYVFPVCAVEKEIQEAVMPSRHIGQLAVSLSSQTANARFSSSLLKKKIKIQILFFPTREKINTKYKLFLFSSSRKYSLLPCQFFSTKIQLQNLNQTSALIFIIILIIRMIMVLMRRSVGAV